MIRHFSFSAAILGSTLVLGVAGAASAQTMSAPSNSLAIQSGANTVAALVADGYEIKAAVPNGAKYVVFLQKDKKAYACEFVSLAVSRCGEIR